MWIREPVTRPVSASVSADHSRNQMIYFLAPANVLFCMDYYVRHNRLDHLVQSISYDQILDRGILPLGSYIFAALDQITPTESKLIARAWDLLSEEFPGASLMNDPRRVLLRYPLLQAAYATGDCSFRARRASRVPASIRLPAFVRCEREHTGNLTPLLHSRAQISIWTARLVAGGYRLRDLIVCEFEDTSERGVFRKYSAQCIHGQIIPRSLVVNRDWLTKDDGRILNAQTIREDFEFSEQNPHESWLKTIFARAGITYGRADYAVVDGSRICGKSTRTQPSGPDSTTIPCSRGLGGKLFNPPARCSANDSSMPWLTRMIRVLAPQVSISELPAAKGGLYRSNELMPRESRPIALTYRAWPDHPFECCGTWERPLAPGCRRARPRRRTNPK